jgi:hypothetical protein
LQRYIILVSMRWWICMHSLSSPSDPDAGTAGGS